MAVSQWGSKRFLAWPGAIERLLQRDIPTSSSPARGRDPARGHDCTRERAAAEFSSVIRPPGGIPAEDTEAPCQSGLVKVTVSPPSARDPLKGTAEGERSPWWRPLERFGGTVLSLSPPRLGRNADRLALAPLASCRGWLLNRLPRFERRYLLHGLIVALASVGAAAAMAG